MNKRTFTDDIFTQDLEIELKNLVHCTIENLGTKDIKVSKRIIAPGASYNIPPAGDFVFSSLTLKVSFTGSNIQENNAYITKSYAVINDNC